MWRRLSHRRRQLRRAQGVTVKFVELVPVPDAFVTEIGPVVAPAGTLARSEVDENTFHWLDGVTLNVTADTPVKPCR